MEVLSIISTCFCNRLADSVENLRDKLSAHAGMQLFRARKEAAAARNRRDRDGDSNDNNNSGKGVKRGRGSGSSGSSGLSRSRSWQGFDTAEARRIIRQQEFWDSNR